MSEFESSESFDVTDTAPEVPEGEPSLDDPGPEAAAVADEAAMGEVLEETQDASNDSDAALESGDDLDKAVDDALSEADMSDQTKQISDSSESLGMANELETTVAIDEALEDASQDVGSDADSPDYAENAGQPEGEPAHFRHPVDDKVVGPERLERYASPETLPEKEPGVGPKPSWDAPPEDMPSDDQVSPSEPTENMSEGAGSQQAALEQRAEITEHEYPPQSVQSESAADTMEMKPEPEPTMDSTSAKASKVAEATGEASSDSPSGPGSPPPLPGDGGDGYKYTELIQDEYGTVVRDRLTGRLYDLNQRDALEKEGQHIMAEREAIEKWKAEVGDPKAYVADIQRRMYEPSEPTENMSERAASQQVGLEQDTSVDANQGHLVPDTVIQGLDTLVDEKKATEIAKHEYPHKSIQDLPDANLRGVAHEGTVYRQLEDEHGPDHVIAHPEGLTLQDGRRVEPDFAVTDDKGNTVELVDAKGYTRKDTHNPQASASSLTHMQSLDKASRYIEVDETTVEDVKFYAPAETANMKAVQEAVSRLGTDERPVSIEAAGTEAELKQRMADLRKDPAERFTSSDRVKSEIEKIQALPVEERRAAMGEFVQSLKDDKGDETTEGRNLRWSTRIERNGDGITIIGGDGQEHTIWFVDRSES